MNKFCYIGIYKFRRVITFHYILTLFISRFIIWRIYNYLLPFVNMMPPFNKKKKKENGKLYLCKLSNNDSNISLDYFHAFVLFPYLISQVHATHIVCNVLIKCMYTQHLYTYSHIMYSKYICWKYEASILI